MTLVDGVNERVPQGAGPINVQEMEALAKAIPRSGRVDSDCRHTCGGHRADALFACGMRGVPEKGVDVGPLPVVA